MSGLWLFKEEQLRLCVVAALTSGASCVAEALLLPPKPLESSASWNCHTGKDNDWLCQNHKSANYSASYTATRQTPRQPHPVPENPQQTMALPVFRPEPEIMPEREVPAGLPVSDASESAILTELLNSPQSHYVLQWLAANERQSLEKLKRRYPILQDATIAHYRRSGKDWYVLLDGPYSSRIAAVAALKSSPRTQMARELYPWTRSVASIQRLDLVRPEPNLRQLANHYSPNDSEQPSFSRDAFSRDAFPREVQLAEPVQQPLAYGQEFDENRYQSYPPTVSDQVGNEMYASIAPAYGSRISDRISGQHSRTERRSEIRPEIDYNSYPQPVTTPIQNDSTYDQPESQPVYRPTEDVLNGESNSYTIEWMTSGRRATLERAQRRYNEFRDTQILHYRHFNRDRYVLVSKIFGNRRDAVAALSRPSLSMVSARLSPRVRQIGYLQQLIGTKNNPVQQIARVRKTTKTQPVRYKKPVPRYQQPSRRIASSKAQSRDGTVLRYSKTREPAPAPNNTLYNAPDNSYTIQWFAANTIQSVEKMKKRFPELAAATTVHFRRNQKDWYVLVQGQFSNSYEAIEAIKSPALKQAMLVLHPWTRPVDSLKKLQIVSR